MEDGNPPTGWGAMYAPEIFERSAVQKYSGFYAAHIIDSAASFGGFQKNIIWQPGKTYKVSFWYFVVNGTLWAKGVDNDGVTELWSAMNLTGANWQYKEYIVNPSLGPGFGWFGFFNASDLVAAEFYIDDVSIGEI